MFRRTITVEVNTKQLRTRLEKTLPVAYPPLRAKNDGVNDPLISRIAKSEQTRPAAGFCSKTAICFSSFSGDHVSSASSKAMNSPDDAPRAVLRAFAIPPLLGKEMQRMRFCQG